MQKKDFQEFSESIVTDCRSAIRRLAALGELTDIYTFVLEFDPVYGRVNGSLNTLSAYDEFIRQNRQQSLSESDDCQDCDEYGFRGPKYCICEFCRLDFVVFSDKTVALGDKYCRAVSSVHDLERECTAIFSQYLTSDDSGYKVPRSTFLSSLSSWLGQLIKIRDRCKEDPDLREAWLDEQCMLAVVNVVRGLTQDFAMLNTTADFIAYVSYYVEDEDVEKQLMLRTVPQALFGQLFPGIAEFDELVAHIQQLETPKQISFWLKAYSDWCLKQESQTVKDLVRWRKSMSDVETQVVNLGSKAVHSIIDHLEHYIFLPQLQREESVDKNSGGFTEEHDFCMMLTSSLEKIGECDSEAVERLHLMLQKLFSHERKQGLIGLNQCSLAWALCRLDFDRFPEQPNLGGKDNQLLNWESFGLLRS